MNSELRWVEKTIFNINNIRIWNYIIKKNKNVLVKKVKFLSRLKERILKMMIMIIKVIKLGKEKEEECHTLI